MFAFALEKATKHISSHTAFQDPIKNTTSNDIDSINKKKIRNGNDVEASENTASKSDFPAGVTILPLLS